MPRKIRKAYDRCLVKFAKLMIAARKIRKAYDRSLVKFTEPVTEAMSQLRRKEKNSCFAKAEKTGRTVVCYAAAPALFRSAGEGKQGSAALRRRENDFRKRECRKRKGTRGDECLFRIHFSLGSEDRSGMYSITSQTPQCRI